MPLVAFAAACFGSAALVSFLRQEWRRVNEELDAADAAEERAPDLPTLRRDAQTGEWRL